MMLLGTLFPVISPLLYIQTEYADLTAVGPFNSVIWNALWKDGDAIPIRLQLPHHCTSSLCEQILTGYV